MKKLIYILFLLTLVSCDDFLDINPKSVVVDDDLFKNDEGFQDALYGVYSGMGDDYLYGKVLSVTSLELCAQTLYTESSTSIRDREFSKLEYSNSTVNSVIEQVWKRMYEKIGYTNNILQNLEEKSEKDLRYYNLYKGEALALRAAMHFDLLRLFAVNINSNDAEGLKRAIPYRKHYDHKISSFKSVEEVYAEIIADLKAAEKLLEEDKQNIFYPRRKGGFYFTDSRITHLNIYGVQALLARVYWQKNDMENAALYAKKVIDSDMFHFMPKTDLKDKLASVMSMTETIWGLYKYTFWKTTKAICGGESSSLYLTPLSASAYDTEPGIGKDYRIEWIQQSDTGFPLLRKLYNVKAIDKDKEKETYDDDNGYLGINMIRIPEMYLIMAEYLLDKNKEEASQYYDALIMARGVVSLKEQGIDLTRELIMQQRRKEFIGEGQEWFRMKRDLEEVNIYLSGITRPGIDAIYKWPYPDIEDERNK